jgi:hypothetical protein
MRLQSQSASQTPVHPSYPERNWIVSLSRHFPHRFPRNHTSHAIRSSVLPGKTAHSPPRNSLTHPTTTLHDTFLWHSSDHWLSVTEAIASPVKDGSTTSLSHSAPYMRRGISMTGVSRIPILLPHLFHNCFNQCE